MILKKAIIFKETQKKLNLRYKFS